MTIQLNLSPKQEELREIMYGRHWFSIREVATEYIYPNFVDNDTINHITMTLRILYKKRCLAKKMDINKHKTESNGFRGEIIYYKWIWA